MVVHNVGSGLATVFPDLDGKKINDAFLLARPLVEFTWNMVGWLVSLRVWTLQPWTSAIKQLESVHRSSPTPTTCLRSCPRSPWRGKGTFTTESRVRVEAMQTLAGVCFRRSRTCWLVVRTVSLQLVAVDVLCWCAERRELEHQLQIRKTTTKKNLCGVYDFS